MNHPAIPSRRPSLASRLRAAWRILTAPATPPAPKHPLGAWRPEGPQP